MPRGVAEPANPEYPLILLTGRGTSAQWHTNTRTGKSAVLRLLYPEEVYVEIHPQDAKRLGIKAGGKAQIHSRRGTLVANALLTSTVNPGEVFVPMHYDGLNQLTFASFDPYSRQPSYKHCAVRVEPVRE
jgi:assimilatory nitrate reductase catalytic subunit